MTICTTNIYAEDPTEIISKFCTNLNKVMNPLGKYTILQSMLYENDTIKYNPISSLYEYDNIKYNPISSTLQCEFIIENIPTWTDKDHFISKLKGVKPYNMESIHAALKSASNYYFLKEMEVQNLHFN